MENGRNQRHRLYNHPEDLGYVVGYPVQGSGGVDSEMGYRRMEGVENGIREMAYVSLYDYSPGVKG